MKLKELLKYLEKMKQEQGEDIEVAIRDNFDGDMPKRLEKISIEQVKEHYNVFFLTEQLDTGGYGYTPAFTEPYQSEIKARKTLDIILLS